MIFAMENFSVPPVERALCGAVGVDVGAITVAVVVVVGGDVGDGGSGETAGDATTCWVCAAAEADSMLGLFVDSGTPGSEHGCMPRGLCREKEDKQMITN